MLGWTPKPNRHRSPALSRPCAGRLPTQHRHSPPPYTGALTRAVLTLSVAIHYRSTLHCDGTLCCRALELFFGLCGRTMQAPKLLSLLHSSPPSSAGTLPYTMTAIGKAKATGCYWWRGCLLGSLVVGRATASTIRCFQLRYQYHILAPCPLRSPSMTPDYKRCLRAKADIPRRAVFLANKAFTTRAAIGVTAVR